MPLVPPSPPSQDEPLRLLIVDDEPLARLRLRSLLEAEPGVVVAGEAGDAVQAQALLGEAAAVDAVLLDIRMPGLDGLRLAALLQARPQPPAVLFVTAHAEHALRAFALEALDYLTKPVRRERLQAALLRLRQRRRPAASPGSDGPVLVVSDRGRVLRLPLGEVLLLRAGQKYVTLRTAAHAHVLDESLSELEQRLQALLPTGAPGFIRIHRNALVAVRAIRALELRELPADEAGSAPSEGWAVRVALLDEWLPVSRRQVAAVRAALGAPGGAAPG